MAYAPLDSLRLRNFENLLGCASQRLRSRNAFDLADLDAIRAISGDYQPEDGKGLTCQPARGRG